MSKFFSFDTLSLHAGQTVDPEFGSRAQPIHQTTSYVFPDTDTASSLFNLERGGHVYNRITNPTVSALEQRIAALEGGSQAVCTSSGMSAIFCALTALVSQGDHVAASSQMYGGNISLLKNTLTRYGITSTFFDPTDMSELESSIQENTKLVFGELIGNPGLAIMDLEESANICGSHQIPLMIDGTFNTPYLCRCFDFGVNIIVHSLTKWMGGHGTAIGGVVVDGGNFDWGATTKFPTLTEPYEGYNGLNFADEFGTQAFLTRARAEGMKDFGACLSPANAFYILQGIETLPLRMQKHVINAQAVAEFLDQADEVEWVNYPGLKSHQDFNLAKKLLPKGAGAILSFGLQGGRAAGRKFIETVQLASHLANVGDAKTLVIHPASTTHQQMNAEALEAAGIDEGMIRLSVGLEDSEDIITDLKRALRSAAKV